MTSLACTDCASNKGCKDVLLRLPGAATVFSKTKTMLCAECRHRLRGKWKNTPYWAAFMAAKKELEWEARQGR